MRRGLAVTTLSRQVKRTESKLGAKGQVYIHHEDEIEWRVVLVSTIVKSGRSLFLCDVCGLGYADTPTAQECQNWCEKYPSCNLAISRKAIHRPSWESIQSKFDHVS